MSRYQEDDLSYEADVALWEEEQPLSTQEALAVVRAYEMSLRNKSMDSEDIDMNVEVNISSKREMSISDRIAASGNKSKSNGNTTSSATKSDSSSRVPFSSSATSISAALSSGSLGSLTSSDDLQGIEGSAKAPVSPPPPQPSSALNIVVLHLDLGIGGAERLMVNVAMSLQSLGHNVLVATTHHDPLHCFEETKPWVRNAPGANTSQGSHVQPTRGGVLGNKIIVYGDWLPRRIPLIGATALCSTIRMVYLSVVLLVLHVFSMLYAFRASLEESDLPPSEPSTPTTGMLSTNGSPSGSSKSGRSSPRTEPTTVGVGTANRMNSPKLQKTPAVIRNPYRIDAVVLDGISFPLPLFAFMNIPSIFYCHFPDKLLVQYNNNKDVMQVVNEQLKKGEDVSIALPNPHAHNGDTNWLRRSYRYMLDTAEELCLGCANMIMVNSKFTEAVFKASFTLLGKDIQPLVVYPTLDPPIVRQESSSDLSTNQNDKISGKIELLSNPIQYLHALVSCNQKYEKIDSIRTHVFVSLNRYERKKKVELALEALRQLQELTMQANKSPRSSLRLSSAAGIDGKPAKAFSNDRYMLVIAGGYDSAVDENIEYLLFLKSRCDQLGLRYVDERWNARDTVSCQGTVHVVFRTSISSAERTSLLSIATALLYTPDNEHFGIVPLECMQRGTPVVAVNSGGPRETVLHRSTGFLCEQTADSFAKAMLQLVQIDEAVDSFVAPVEPTDENVYLGRIVRSPMSLQMGASGKNHVEQNFHSNVMRRQFLGCLQQLFPDRVFQLDKESGTKFGRAKGRSRYIGTSGARVRTSSNDDAPATFVPFDDGSLTRLSAPTSPTPSAAKNGGDANIVVPKAKKPLSQEARYLLEELHRTRPKKDHGDGFDTDYGNEKGNLELLLPGAVPTPFDDQQTGYNASYISAVAQSGANRHSVIKGSALKVSTPRTSKYTNASAITSSWQAQKEVDPSILSKDAGLNKHVLKYSGIIRGALLHFLCCVFIVIGVPVMVMLFAE